MKSIVIKLIGVALIASALSGCIIIDRSGENLTETASR